MYTLTCKPGVIIGTPAPAGFRILSALETTARRLKVHLVITCGTEGHPPDDPHSRSEAYDVRMHTLTEDMRRLVLRAVMQELADADNPMDAPMASGDGLGTLHFWGWIEKPGEPAVHLHVQRRHGTVYV